MTAFALGCGFGLISKRLRIVSQRVLWRIGNPHKLSRTRLFTNSLLKAAQLPLWNMPAHAKREKRMSHQERFRMKFTFIAPLAALLLVSPSAFAQEGPGKACKADREKFCSGMKPGDGQLGACMKQHEAELSPECNAARKGAQEARQNIRMSCKADTEKFCADAPNDHGGVIKCLESHASELGQSCADALKSRPGAKKS
jgi:hypothetical protein